jgi:hypothetical protein
VPVQLKPSDIRAAAPADGGRLAFAGADLIAVLSKWDGVGGDQALRSIDRLAAAPGAETLRFDEVESPRLRLASRDKSCASQSAFRAW